MAIDAFTRKDAALQRTKALPAAASSSVSCDPIDLQNGPDGHLIAPCLLRVLAPALNDTILPDTRTATYIIEHADTLSGGALSSPVTLYSSFILQTGAGGAGAAAVTKDFRLPPNVKRYVGVKCTFGASTTTGAAVSMVVDLLTAGH